MRAHAQMFVLLIIAAGCQVRPERDTIAGLRDVVPDLEDVPVDDSLAKALAGYQNFLQVSSHHAMAPEAMRRMADLQIEREHGIVGVRRDTPAPPPSAPRRATIVASAPITSAAPDSEVETAAEFEARASAADRLGERAEDLSLPDGSLAAEHSGPAQAIATYKQILSEYPWYERNDQVLYQMARAYDELAQPEEAIRIVERLIAQYPDSPYLDEVLFRRGEYYFVRRKFRDAEQSYQSVVAMGEGDFYELALYKLGWSLYKQEFYEEALHPYIALLDYKLSIGYDFDQGLNADADHEAESEEQRVADTFRVISLSFSNLGGPDVLAEYFEGNGRRSFEDRIYANLAEFHLEKLRYNDAASVYNAFVERNPLHKVAPRFSMRVADVYEAGDFPLLVVESKRDFAVRYGIDAEYWQHFEIDSMPEVRDYLKQNLIDLANHYHALYQSEGLEEDRPKNYAEALRWYDTFLSSFPHDPITPSINYQLADILLEHGDFARAAHEYERTAYDYDAHERSAEAGYAAIYAHRRNLEGITDAEAPAARLAAVESSLKFAETFPQHEHASTVLGAATEDLFDMGDFARAVSAGRWLIDGFPDAEPALRRSAWMIVGHGSFELASYPDAEAAYQQVISLSGPDDEDLQAVSDNLAAAIYKQGELARADGDLASAAAHFLRVKSAAPESEIRPAAEYDAAAALVELEDWQAAAAVLEDFRATYPDHDLAPQATRQLATAYEKSGDLSRSAAEYERMANESVDVDLQREARLVAGDLYERAEADEDALRVYQVYVAEHPEPLEAALEVHSKIAEMHKAGGDDAAYRDELAIIVARDAAAGAVRTDRTRYLAATSALVLSEPLFDEFERLRLVQPFEQSLTRKRQMMDRALAAFESLVAYEVGEVTAAATYYIAELYRSFSVAMLESERPRELDGSDLTEYELVLEEQAYPFEEQAIAVHRENVALMRIGVFNPWVQRSLDELAVMMPGRYAKAEISGGYVGAIDQYAYRPPVTPTAVDPEPASETAVDDRHDDATVAGVTEIADGYDD